MASTKFKCPYCGKEFTRERTLQVHMCEPKRRHLQKDEKWVINAFMVYQRFYQIHQNNSKEKTVKSTDSQVKNSEIKQYFRIEAATAMLAQVKLRKRKSS